ncbi:uncharacterized protein BDCG_00126 [Blastomyces dermatitidis ER-3]|uniref:SET domain-containing protein n=1 Tax=Ajellomyces dermatitidis (strain ER-3 / ATCC MYA-2586) TaxID=559297 RepID=A0ABP2EP34_AJEDR|nr:uncharacterized protein BDCG_00126 [Blastomyces dermatitidis ER-3]EEQ83321.1 hypothetical protein BDCG_00126 [Blastomyces dermatitidis ER-3]
MQLNLAKLTKHAPAPIYENQACGNRGLGLVAKKRFEEGECIICEEVIVSSTTLQSAGGSVRLYNNHLAQQVKSAKNPAFSRRFFQLPHLSKEEWGPMGAIFERGSIPVPPKSRALGLDSAYLNHSCLPNAQHSLAELTFDGTGNRRNFLIVYACRTIEEGEEITIPYESLYLDRVGRQQFLLQEYGFECACKLCEKEDAAIEAGLELIFLKLPIIFLEHAIDNEPAGILQVAHTILDIHLTIGLTDNRFARILEHCAKVCVWHSDVGRALVFLSKARNSFLSIQGVQGKDYLRVTELQRDPMKIAGAGRTKRGLSSKADTEVIRKNKERDTEIMFMLNAKDLGDYIKLSEYDDAAKGTTIGVEDGNDRQLDPKIDIDQLVKELELEKKQHDKSRHRRGSSSDEKPKKGRNKRGHKYKKKGKGKAVADGVNTADGKVGENRKQKKAQG